MRKKILIALALLVGGGAGLCATIAMQPSTFTVQRSATIAAPPDEVFAQVDDLKAWDAWSPWKKLDPNPKVTLSSPSAGKGATITWAGNDEIGEGSMTILESKPGELVDLEQAFIRPLPGKARIAFTFAPEADGTKVTWKMDGTNDFLGKAMCMLMDMDALLGKDMAQGLANMKAVVEKGATESASAAP
jgi:uncharacterized protein YndB with AHSA1/START domain